MPLDRWKARRRFFVRAVILAWTVIFGALHVVQVAAPDRPGHVPLDVRLQVRWLERSLDDGDAALMQRFFPEGDLFTHEFYGLALQNIAETTRDPDDIARAERVVRAMLPTIDALLARPPFSSMKRAELRGGICWFAGQNLLRARLIALSAAPDPAEVARFHDDSALLERAFRTSATGVLEAYPGMTWPVDSLFGYRSLQIHDQLYGTRYLATFAKYKSTLRRAADGATGLPPSFLHLDGRPRDFARGCALSWSLAVLYDLDPAYAAEQWAAYRREFGRCALGLCLFREWPTGVERTPDADSGPIVAGLGMSASAFALAAARAEGDWETAEALRRTGELFGLPAISWWGKRYVGGAVTLFDIFSLWTRTVPTPASERAAIAWPVVIALAAVWSIVAALALRALRRARRELALARGGSRVEAMLFAASVLALVLHLVWPAFVGVALIVVFDVLSVVSRVVAGAGRRVAAAVSASST